MPPSFPMQFTLQQGDVVVMASDGLFDNIWDEQVRDACQAAMLTCSAIRVIAILRI